MPIDAAICRNQLRPTYLLNKKFKGARRLKNNHNAFTRDEITGVLYMEIVKNKLNENFINYRIAHRGLHGDGVCENSLEAFRRAIEAGYGIELDVEFHEVKVDGKRAELTANEFSILDLFMSSPGRVFSRDAIITALHGDGYPVTDRAVDVSIVNLRKKLGDKAAYIETVRGVGYKMKKI